jgi:hypothetical protein
MFTTPDIYYPKFEINSNYIIPASLKNILLETWSRRYSELYEENPDSQISLENTFKRLLNDLWNESTPSNAHKRYVWIAYSLGLATQPTVESYLPNEKHVQLLLRYTSRWINGELEEEDHISQNLFPHLSIGSQSIDEAIDVFRNLQRMINDSESSQTALLEILDDCIEGYAIFPGTEGRRDLFNWLLLEVIPAAWGFQSPNFLYTMKQPWPPISR